MRGARPQPPLLAVPGRPDRGPPWLGPRFIPLWLQFRLIQEGRLS